VGYNSPVVHRVGRICDLSWAVENQTSPDF